MELFLKLIDRAIAFTRERERNKRAYFDEIVVPLFEEIQSVIDEFMQYFSHALDLCSSEASSDVEISKSVRKERYKSRAARLRVQELACAIADKTDDSDMVAFCEAIAEIFSNKPIFHLTLKFTTATEQVQNLMEELEERALSREEVETIIGSLQHRVTTAWATTARIYGVLRIKAVSPDLITSGQVRVASSRTRYLAQREKMRAASKTAALRPRSSQAAELTTSQTAELTTSQTAELKPIEWHLVDFSEGERYSITPLTLIGRRSYCDINLKNSCASAKHAAIFEIAEMPWIRDLNSTNGTFINGERLASKHSKKLLLGDVITFGNDGAAFLLAKGMASSAQHLEQRIPPAGSAESPTLASSQDKLANETQETQSSATIAGSLNDNSKSETGQSCKHSDNTPSSDDATTGEGGHRI